MLIVKKFEFEMAHCLDGHNRGCNNVHGHSYKLDVGYEINTSEIIKKGSSEGMGVDFNHLKKTVNEAIIETADHAFIYNKNNDNEVKIAKTLQTLNKKTIMFNCRTTCEMMSLFMLQKLYRLDHHFKFIRLYETSGSYVETTLDDLINWEVDEWGVRKNYEIK